MTIINRLADNITNWTLNLLFGCTLTDVNTCFKAFRKEVLNGITITAKGFEFETEFTAKVLQRKFQIFEIPIIYQARSKEASKKMTWRKALKIYRILFKLRFS